MRNAHYKSAEAMVKNLVDGQGSYGNTPNTLILKTSVAQTEATLALAYAQETANLIAVAEGMEFSPTTKDHAYTEVLERMGLNS